MYDLACKCLRAYGRKGFYHIILQQKRDAEIAPLISG